MKSKFFAGLVIGLFLVGMAAGMAQGASLLLAADDEDGRIYVLKAALEETGLSLDAFDARNATPTLTELQQYDSILVWSNYYFYDRHALGDALADYVDSGGRVVTAFTSDGFAQEGQTIGGRFENDEYDAFTIYPPMTVGSLSLGAVLDPSSPLMEGVDTLEAFGHYSTSPIRNTYTEVVMWANGYTLASYTEQFNGTIVSLNLYPFSGATWSTTDGFQFVPGNDDITLMANALNFGAPELPENKCLYQGDFDCDGDVDAADLEQFATLYGETYSNPQPLYPAPVPISGQIDCFDESGTDINCIGTGQDGELRSGKDWPDPRFTLNVNPADDDGSDGGIPGNGICDGAEICNGTVTDNLTGLIWLQNANCFGTRNWTNALSDVMNVDTGECGLTDGSAEGNWRLPQIQELQSIIDYGRNYPALPANHPFLNVQLSNYWSSTTFTHDPGAAWFVSLPTGGVNGAYKNGEIYVWPVRGGQ